MEGENVEREKRKERMEMRGGENEGNYKRKERKISNENRFVYTTLIYRKKPLQ